MTMTYEEQEIMLLRTGKLHQVLGAMMFRFQLEHKSLPEVVYLNSSLQMNFVVELIKDFKLTPEAAVLEPVWLAGMGKEIPLLYSNQLGEHYVQMINRKLSVVETL